jgi:hypothetical protein
VADIALDLGSVTLGIDLPFIEIPKATVGVGFDIPLNPAVSVGADLRMLGSPNAIQFELSVGVKLLQFLTVDYTIKTWTVSNPLAIPQGSLILEPPFIPTPEPIPNPDMGWEVTFDVPGTLQVFGYGNSEFRGSSIQGAGVFTLGAGGKLKAQQAEGPGGFLGCAEGSTYQWFVNGGFAGQYCKQGYYFTLGKYSQGIFFIFTPSQPGEPIRYFPTPLNPLNPMSCTCAEIDLLLETKLNAKLQTLANAITCVGEDTRALRTAFLGTPQTTTITYNVAGVGLLPAQSGDIVQVEVIPVTLPPGSDQWLTDPKLYQIGIINPIFQDGAYGAPQTLIAPFGSTFRLPVSIANVRRFYYFFNPLVSVTIRLTVQTGANTPTQGWCTI